MQLDGANVGRGLETAVPIRIPTTNEIIRK